MKACTLIHANLHTFGLLILTIAEKFKPTASWIPVSAAAAMMFVHKH